MANILLGVIILLVVAGFAAIIYLFRRAKAEAEKPADTQSFLLLQNQVADISRTLDSKLSESTRAIQQHSGESVRIIRDVTQELVKVVEGQKQVMSVTDQLKNLQDILKNPKQRGILGEYFLETVLKNIVPGSYTMQYAFKDGTVVDAVVFFGKQVIPIDSKFSLENYNRILGSALGSQDRKRYEAAFIADLKTRIDETSKYVKPEDGTMDFAFMFIPSEAIFSDLLENKVGDTSDETQNLISYAWRKRVSIVAPTTLAVNLQTVVQVLRNQKISEQAKEIIKQVENLGRHLKGYDDYLKKLGGHLDTTVNTYNFAYKEFKKIDKDVLKISGEAIGVEPILLSRTDVEEDAGG